MGNINTQDETDVVSYIDKGDNGESTNAQMEYTYDAFLDPSSTVPYISDLSSFGLDFASNDNHWTPHPDAATRFLESFQNGGKQSADSANDSAPTTSNVKFDIAYVESADIEMPLTTLMLRNIPWRLTQDALFQDIKERGFAKDVDFVHVPVEHWYKCNLGYCLVNLKTVDGVRRFRQAYQRTMLTFGCGSTVCHVSVAKVQGLESNIAFCRNSDVMDEEEIYRPLLVVDGEPQVLTTGKEEACRRRETEPGHKRNGSKPLIPRFSEFEPMRVEWNQAVLGSSEHPVKEGVARQRVVSNVGSHTRYGGAKWNPATESDKRRKKGRLDNERKWRKVQK